MNPELVALVQDAARASSKRDDAERALDDAVERCAELQVTYEVAKAAEDAAMLAIVEAVNA